MTNLPCVEDIFNQGTCDWICTADTDIDEESRNMLANGNLAKFRVLYEEEVHGECVNQTDAKNSSATASLWLKMAASGKRRKKLKGRLQLVTQTTLEGIFGGQFAFGTYKELNVSCVFKSTSIGKSGSNHSSGRLTFHTLQSVLYFVEHVVNFSKPDVTFLTLFRTEKNTLLSVGVTSTSSGSLSSGTSAKDNELIVTDEWLAVAIIIWIVVLLYFPAIFIFFRPSEIKLKVPRKKRKVQEDISSIDEAVESADPTGWVPDLRMPIQDTDRREPPLRQNRNLLWGNNFEHPEDDGIILSRSDNNAPGSHEGSESAEGTRGNSLSREIQHGGDAIPGYSGSAVARETKIPSDQDSEITLPRRYGSKASRRNDGRVKMLKERFEPKSVNEKNPTKLGLPQDLDGTDDTPGQDRESGTEYARRFSADCSFTRDVRPLRSETPPTRSSTIMNDAEQVSTLQSNRSIDEPSAAKCNSLNDAELASTSQSNINIEEQSTANSLNDAEQPSTSQSYINIEEQSTANSLNDAEQASTSQSYINIEEQSTANSLNGADLASTSRQSERNIEEQRAANSPNETRVDLADIGQSSAEENDEETGYVLAIIIEETYPVGLGSCIGNKLFSTTHERNIAWNIVKLIFMFFALPLLFFLGLGDLFLVILPKLHSRLSDHLPFTFLTSSLGYGIINNHPVLLIPILVVSALAYLIRLSCLCFLPSSKLEACSIHRMHPTCLACKLLQYFISEPRSSLNACENCRSPAPSECSKYLDLPENISHNLEKQPDIFIKCWESFLDLWRKRRSSSSPKGILLSLVLVALLTTVIIIFIIIGIFCTSPLVCLCHGRLRRMSRVVESSLIFFSLVWVTIFSLLCAIPLGVATVGLIKVLGSHTNEVLPQVTIAVLALHYFWSCYKSFRAPYRCVAKCLASRYQVSYREQEKKSGVNELIHYKQGDLKVLPKELFNDGCKEFNLSIKNDIALLFVRLLCTLLAFCFVFPILGSDDVSDTTTTSTIATFLAVAYILISNAINGEEFQISKEVADDVVDDYIARKQRDSS